MKLGPLLSMLALVASGDALADAWLEADPLRALTDEPVRIRAGGLDPGQVAVLRATARDAADTLWESHSEFRADADGHIDPARQAPIAGTYAGVDPRGLFWSMRPLLVDGGPRFQTDGFTSMAIRIRLEGSGQVLDTAELERIYPWAGDALHRETVDVDGLVGTLWRPHGGENLPAVLLLGGSGGASQSMRSALLAARGYAVLDLLYFGRDPLPQELIEIPLEYFAAGLEWLRSHPATSGDPVGVFGSSKGAEAALLVGTLDPNVGAVVAYLPSAVVWQGLSFRISSSKSSWSLDGEPLPFVPFSLTPSALWRTVKFLMGRPVSVFPTYERGLENEEAVSRAAIPVERIRGAVLLVSGTDDRVWPGAELGNRVVERLHDYDFPYPYRHLAFEGAGHGLGVPYFPRSRSRVSSWSGSEGRLIHGGSAQPDERASALGWAATLDFFDEHLRSHLSAD